VIARLTPYVEDDGGDRGRTGVAIVLLRGRATAWTLRMCLKLFNQLVGAHRRSWNR
jgi:hypothetical protein